MGGGELEVFLVATVHGAHSFCPVRGSDEAGLGNCDMGLEEGVPRGKGGGTRVRILCFGKSVCGSGVQGRRVMGALETWPCEISCL